MEKTLDSWSDYYRYRKTLRNRFGPIWDVPIIKRELPLILAHLGKGARVLEIGASRSNRYLPGIKEAYQDVVYKSMDVDRSTEQDFYSLDEITGEYDLVMMFEVLEHLDLAAISEVLGKSYEVTADGGTIIASTPNLFHPHRFWDSTHKTPLRYEELGALMMIAGYQDIKVYRKHTEPFVKKMIRYTVGMPLHRMLDVDFAKTIVVEGRKQVSGNAAGT